MINQNTMKVIKREKRNSLWIFRMISFALTTLICLGVFAFFREAPFGDKTLAASDAFIQYMDLMAFFKDVLSGNQSLTYTMTKGLGGAAIGIFSYYLASPTELLQLFFSKDQVPVSYNLAAVLKMGMASLTMTWFLQDRFNNKISMLGLLACFPSVLHFQFCLIGILAVSIVSSVVSGFWQKRRCCISRGAEQRKNFLVIQ